MNYIWDIVIQGKEDGYKKSELFWEQGKEVSPYYEQSFLELNQLQITDNHIEINALVRFEKLFGRFLHEGLIEEDMNFLVQKAKKEIIGIDIYDFEEIRKAYIILLHYRLATMFIAENIDKIISLKDFSEIEISKPIEIYVGGYMEQLVLIDKLEVIN